MSDPGTTARDWALASSVFDVYDELLVPLLFQPYADDLVHRLADTRDASILEVGAGTGVLTRALAAVLPPSVAITATDLVPGMVDRAAQVGAARAVTWETANACALPYGDESFDVVVCQLGAMFFTPKRDAFADAARVLRPGGRFLFSVWDRIEENDFGAAVAAALPRVFPRDPPGFLEHVPYSYHDAAVIEADLRAGGFPPPYLLERVERRSLAASAGAVAAAFCAGTPLRDQIEARGPGCLEAAIDGVTSELEARFGTANLDGRMSALVVSPEKG